MNQLLKQDIILDTCIIQYAFKGRWTSPSEELLHQLEQDGFRIAISAITSFELLRSANKIIKSLVTEKIKVLPRHEVSEKILEFAAELYGFYRSNENVKKISDKISSEDVIIGATTVITDSLLLTNNISDFPAPFFRQVGMWRAETKKGSNYKSLYFHLLKANEQAIDDAKKGIIETMKA